MEINAVQKNIEPISTNTGPIECELIITIKGTFPECLVAIGQLQNYVNLIEKQIGPK